MDMILSSSSDEEDTDNSNDDTMICKAGGTREKRQRGRKKSGASQETSVQCALTQPAPTLINWLEHVFYWNRRCCRKKAGKEILFLACRHHVMELLIGAVFQVCLGSTSAPQVPMFTCFQQYWMFIDRSRFKTGISSYAVSTSVQDIKDSTTEFAKGYLRESQPRDDYREFLELVIIFLGLVPEREIQFMPPGATHHAQWLSKVIYSLKIWMFRGQFCLSKKEEKGCKMCLSKSMDNSSETS
ncbi:hypothetical protein QYM36_016666 [Artemia franciscana]|uniref:Uncharacterized protein n=1 Tax=Artemia franciscana TaxID=6661 RepID=A0AA88KV23_ARTSF|nr:hypothetical protein QYM36_016666 [Artemia franciscana]